MAKLVILDEDIKKLAENALDIKIKSIKKTKDGFELEVNIEDIEKTKEKSIKIVSAPYPVPSIEPYRRTEPLRPYWCETTGGYHRLNWESMLNK